MHHVASHVSLMNGSRNIQCRFQPHVKIFMQFWDEAESNTIQCTVPVPVQRIQHLVELKSMQIQAKTGITQSQLRANQEYPEFEPLPFINSMSLIYNYLLTGDQQQTLMSRLGLFFENSFSWHTPSLENLLSNNLKDKTVYYEISFTQYNISGQQFGCSDSALPEVL